MVSNIEIIRKCEVQTSIWSGGTTTQLLIYPRGAEYGARNFKWRISSAKVEAEESTFTNLPGISRIIMILKGELFLNHEGHYSKTLKPFEQDSFMGDWTTKSEGRVTDFNLMMAEGCTGRLDALTIKSEEITEIRFIRNESFERCTTVFYVVKGKIVASNENKIIQLDECDILAVNLKNDDELKIDIYNGGTEEAKVVKVEVFY